MAPTRADPKTGNLAMLAARRPSAIGARVLRRASYPSTTSNLVGEFEYSVPQHGSLTSSVWQDLAIPSRLGREGMLNAFLCGGTAPFSILTTNYDILLEEALKGFIAAGSAAVTPGLYMLGRIAEATVILQKSGLTISLEPRMAFSEENAGDGEAQAAFRLLRETPHPRAQRDPKTVVRVLEELQALEERALKENWPRTDASRYKDYLYGAAVPGETS